MQNTIPTNRGSNCHAIGPAGGFISGAQAQPHCGENICECDPLDIAKPVNVPVGVPPYQSGDDTICDFDPLNMSSPYIMPLGDDD